MNITTDLRVRHELPEVRTVVIAIGYYESRPVPGIAWDHREHKDCVPDLPALPAFIRAYAEEHGRCIDSVKVWLEGPEGKPTIFDFRRSDKT